MFVEIIADRLEWRGIGAQLAGDASAHQVYALGRLAQACLHGDDRTRHIGHVGGDFADLGQGSAGPLIGQRGTQVGNEPSLLGLGKKLHIQPEDRIQLQKHRHRQRTLVLFHLIQIARTQLQRPGKCGLRQSAFLAQAPQPDAHEGLFHVITIRNIRKRCTISSQLYAFSVV